MSATKEELAAYIAQRKMEELLRQNASIPFVDRILNPQKYGVLDNPDGSYSTHSMAAEFDEEGVPYAFPTVVPNEKGELYRIDDPYEALARARKHGDVMRFDSIEEAINFSKNYKIPSFTSYDHRRGK